MHQASLNVMLLHAYNVASVGFVTLDQWCNDDVFVKKEPCGKNLLWENRCTVVILFSRSEDSLFFGMRNCYNRRFPTCRKATRISTSNIHALVHTMALSDTTFMTGESVNDLTRSIHCAPVFTYNSHDRPEIIEKLNPSVTLIWFSRQSKRFGAVSRL